LRLLCFGRLLPYKGLDLLAAAIPLVCANAQVRVVGSGPESDELCALRTLPRTSVENRWVPEQEIGDLLAWADAVILPYREASQSGVAAAALAAGRFVVATNVGGLKEQLAGSGRAVLCEPTPEGIAAAIDKVPQLDPAADDVGRQMGWGDLAKTLRDALIV
jgi:glycosyltransferase involved in cell wall biosynthesis